MKCMVDKKIMRQVLSVCHVGDLCVVSAKGEAGNDNTYLIQKVFEVQHQSPLQVQELKDEYK